MAATEQQILQLLGGINMPHRNTNLAASGLLSPILVDPDGRVIFSIAIRPEEQEVMELVRKAAEALLVEKLPGHKILISLTAERPKAAAAQSAANSPRKLMREFPNIRHMVAVASGKGGVGKSTVACNIAVALAGERLKVGLLDADIYGPSVPTLFNVRDKPVMRHDGRIEPVHAYGVTLMSIGFMLDPAAAVIWRGPMVMQAVNQLLNDVDWGELDILVVDMPPGTGDAQITIAQTAPLSGAVIVSTPQDLALLDAVRAVTMFGKVMVPIVGMVENMATFICPHCGRESPIFGHGGARHEAGRLNIPFLGEIPLQMAIREASDSGRPVVTMADQVETADRYRAIAAEVWRFVSSPAAKPGVSA
ncbi:MAG: Mrp/NBP35 family ATP-binding protein [Methylobacteriaceae bacterium]|nr:Mrp/NBP35 family ATP-binding protein [Methylobacteriaceae bacterium]